MTAPEALDRLREVPTFSECVVGYRAWSLGSDGLLWPLRTHREPWKPGINTARCACQTGDRLRFEWSVVNGRRVLEPEPAHPAPDDECSCGLYSWRRPQGWWSSDPGVTSGSVICGAVASWGRIQVHATGLRSEHACVVALAYNSASSHATIKSLEQVAACYRVQLVPLADLEQTALQHASPLPDSVHPPKPDRSRPNGQPSPAGHRQQSAAHAAQSSPTSPEPRRRPAAASTNRR